jgi:hypothetical protein
VGKRVGVRPFLFYFKPMFWTIWDPKNTSTMTLGAWGAPCGPFTDFRGRGCSPRFWDPARARKPGPRRPQAARTGRPSRQTGPLQGAGGGISRWMGTGAWMSMVGPQWNFSPCHHQVGGASLQRSGSGRDGTKMTKLCQNWPRRAPAVAVSGRHPGPFHGPGWPPCTRKK